MKNTSNKTIKEFMQAIRSIPDSLSGLLNSFRTKKLKVCMISYHYEEPIMSGVGVHVKYLAKYLSKNGCEVHVFCSGVDNSVYSDDGVIVHNIERIPIPLKDSASKKRFNYLLFEHEVIRQVIMTNQKTGFDVIHSHGIATKSSFILKKVLDIKWIHTFHAVETARVKKLIKEEQRFDDWVSWMESNVSYCDGAIYVSNALKAEGDTIFRLKSAKVIPNGIDSGIFGYHPKSRKNVLFIGRFSKEKGIDMLPKLMKKIIDETTATITIISPSNIIEGELKKIKSEIHTLRDMNPKRITFIENAVNQENVVEFYRNCQIYIQPSRYESFGLCILEAMATGRPVVTYDVGGTKEVVGKTGFAVKTEKQFIRKVMSLIDDKDECRNIGHEAYLRSRLFDWDKISREVMKYYEETIK